MPPSASSAMIALRAVFDLRVAIAAPNVVVAAGTTGADTARRAGSAGIETAAAAGADATSSRSSSRLAVEPRAVDAGAVGWRPVGARGIGGTVAGTGLELVSGRATGAGTAIFVEIVAIGPVPPTLGIGPVVSLGGIVIVRWLWLACARAACSGSLLEPLGNPAGRTSRGGGGTDSVLIVDGDSPGLVVAESSSSAAAAAAADIGLDFWLPSATTDGAIGGGIEPETLPETSGTSSSRCGLPESCSGAPHAISAAASSSGWPLAFGVGFCLRAIGDATLANIGADARPSVNVLPVKPLMSRANAQSHQVWTSRGVADRLRAIRTLTSASRSAAALSHRCSGALASSLSTMSSTSLGTPSLNVDGGATSPRCTLSRVWYSFFCANSGRAVSSSWNTTPAANRSERASSSLPAIDSGAMYASLPLTRPVWVASCADTALAIPKSITLRWPLRVSSKFDGDRSRWTMPSGLPLPSVRWCA